MSEYMLYVFIRQSVNTWVVSTVVNYAVVNMGVEIFLQYLALNSVGTYPEVELLYLISETLHTVFRELVPFYYLTQIP
jgi:hypothetical protein